MSEQSDTNTNTNTDIINLYLIYYKKRYPEKEFKSLFQDINHHDKTSTNHAMESLFEDMIEYKKQKFILVKEEDLQKDSFKEDDDIYCLKVKTQNIIYSTSVYALLVELYYGYFYKSDIINIDWHIIKFN